MKNSNYKIVLRNINTNEIELYGYNLMNNEKHALVQVDELMAKYNSKEQFIKEYLKKEDFENYDVYITYNTNEGNKFLDCYFGINTSNDERRKKIIENLVNKGLKNEEFISYLRECKRNIYKKFDHYNKKEFYYNKIKKRMDAYKAKDYDSANVYAHQIVAILESDYLLLRKLIDSSYRYTKKINDAGIYDIDRKRALYKKSKETDEIISGQLSFDFNNLDQYTKNNDIKSDTIDESDIKNLYFELLNSSDKFYSEYILPSDLTEKLKDYTNRYLKSSCISEEDEHEYEHVKAVINNEITKKVNNKKIIDIIKNYYIENNKKYVK